MLLIFTTSRPITIKCHSPCRQNAPPAEYKVNLILQKPAATGDDSISIAKPEQLFSGSGSSPYAAMREASKKAKDFFTNFNKEFPSSGSGDSHKNGEAVKKNGNLEELKDEERGVEAGDQNGTDGRSKSELSSEGEDDESRDDVESLNEVLESEDDNVEETPNTQDWVGSLENFFSKALAPKLDQSVTIHYRVKEEAVDEVTVVCEIGKLVVEKTEETFKKAKQQAAKSMLDTIENVLESQNDIIKMIVDQKPAPFRDETALLTDEDEFDEDSNDRDVATVPSSDDDGPAPGPAVMALAASGPVSKSQDTESVPGEMAPGAEYCMALMRTDKPAGISSFITSNCLPGTPAVSG